VETSSLKRCNRWSGRRSCTLAIRECRGGGSLTRRLAGGGPSGPAWRGVYIFTSRHYSMMVASPDRPDITDTTQATADELRALWNPMAANAGVYEVAGNLVTIRPIVAKIPVVMKPGAYEVYAFSVEDNTLSLTQQRNVRGPVEGRATTKLVRLE